MNSNSKLARPQQHCIQHHIQQSDSWQFFNLLTSDTFFDVLEEELPEHRERLFPPTETLSLFLAQAMNDDRSCQLAVNDAAVKRLLEGLPLCSTRTQAYCRARKRLPLSLLCPKKHGKKAIRDFYRQRWHIELDLRNIKTTLGMGVLTCRTPEMVKKELEVYLLAYNLIRYVMLQSALLADILPRQISFKHTLQLWLSWHQHRFCCGV